MKNIEDYQISEFPKSRISTIDIGALSRKKHHIKALIEVDVTDSRIKIQKIKNQKQIISFNSWILKCISEAIIGNRKIHAIRKGKTKVVEFEDIDISILVEREINGKKVPLPYVVRKTNNKSISDICTEIRQAQSQSISDEGNYVLGSKKNKFMMSLYYSLPGIIRRFIWKNILRNPFITKKNMGTVIVTSVGMMGKINGWVIPQSIHPVCFAIGSIIKKPGVVNNEIKIREFLYITALVDHDVIDGAPAVRTLNKLTKYIESGFGL